MIERNIQSRVVNKHDVEKNWNKAINFIPKKGEIIIYDVDENYDYPRLKVGDGETVVSALPFNGGAAKWSDLTEKPFEAEDFANLQADVEEVQTDVETLKAGVSTNKTDISDLSSQINTNKSNISSLQSQINTNKSNISSLQSQVNTNKSNITTLSNSVSSLQNKVSTNTSNITTLNNNVSSLQNKVSTNTSNITTLRSDLNTLSEKVVQSDWNQEDDTKLDYIKNKPRITNDYIILKDKVSRYDYVIEMVNGNLVSRLTVSGIRIVSLEKTSYIEGELINPQDIVVEAICSDGSAQIIDDYICDPVSNGCVTVRYEELGNTLIASKAVEMTGVENALVDFSYTKNADGTCTITGWNGTLNGEPSTELVVPNNILIKL